MSLMLRADLPQSKDGVKNNTLTTYFPINTKDRKDIFNWDSVLGYVVKTSYRKELYLEKLTDDEKLAIKEGETTESEIALATFKLSCERSFKTKLDESDFWPILEKMYFENDQLFKISPEFLLFKTIKQKGSARDASLGGMFSNLLQNFFFNEKPNNQFNFLEEQLYSELLKLMKPSNKEKDGVLTFPEPSEAPYLPFIAKQLQQDLRFLGKRPKYLLSIFKEFLHLYAHLYTAQLALNLTRWQKGEPEAQLCYYILDSEKASDERYLIKDYGFKQLSKSLWNIFPYLSMNESLQSKKIDNAVNTIQPLWALAENLQQTPSSATLLKNYAQAFKESRDLQLDLSDSENPHDVLADLLQLSRMQFGSKETRHEINKLYVKATESEFCSHFAQSRGRAGRVLVFNQDYLLLLTNLAIGEQDKLRFHELIKAFESRGVFFDKQSQQALIKFFERIGNVERMSDSGDAVYVRKTI
ncbi:DNA phosphorothioation-dependent restriction protein DptG [Vibrio cyclitrophicus]|uniref:DNA phosphorothioation-dependent restriction protein DptG n=1 Tax=Vibrio cyclitrophicus TaxID=47951 RepID=UPI00148D1EBD|nr:DNA phosphorothioation-dependent restriction protein DptG [Vibrio cyclitrophicus]NOH18500.1 DNA phosphorothioation-dependent restriction protein DptG [Vibrio cyclitrophicus]